MSARVSGIADKLIQNRWELAVHGLLWGGFVLLLGSGSSNGIGWFQQPGHSLWFPLLAGAACNAVIFVCGGRAAVALVRGGGWRAALRAVGIAAATGLLLKSLLHWTYVQLAVADLKTLDGLDFAVENSYALVAMLILGAIYFLVRLVIVPVPAAERSIQVRSGHTSHRLQLREIAFLKAEANYIAYHTGDRSLLVLQTMNAALAELNDPRFVRVHRSYIVNADQVSAIDSAAITVGRTRIPIGKTYRAQVRKALREQVS